MFWMSHDGDAGSMLTMVVSGYRNDIRIDVSPNAEPTSTNNLFGPSSLDGTVGEIQTASNTRENHKFIF